MSKLHEVLSIPGKTLILDGAMATELEALGADLNDVLWSCKCLLDQPGLIRSVHLSYFKAGADIAITASYQATHKGLMEQKGMSLEESKALIRESVALAQSARDEVLSSADGKDRAMFVAGSVGPYGAYLADGSEYRGDYSLSKKEMKAFHRPRIEALVESGVDMLALETMPSIHEIGALVELLNDEFAGIPAWITCSLKDGTRVSDGTPLEKVYELAKTCTSLVAVGVNCCPPELVASAMKELAKVAEPQHFLICYPNSGETWEASTNTWQGLNDLGGRGWSGLVREWGKASNRVKIIGGCCRTGPNDTRSIKASVDGLKTKT